MQETILKSLYDIWNAIEEIDSFFIEKTKDRNTYAKDTLLRRAIERNFEIIGEAMNRILKEDNDFPITNAHRIIGLRNQIIHGYDDISDETIWSVVVDHLPLLKTEVQKFLKI